MKKLTSKILGIILAGSMMLTGCSSAASKAGSAAQSAAPEKVELKCWIRASSKENNQTITFDEFNASQDKIHVSVEVFGDNYADVLKLAFNSGEAPDIFELAGSVNLKTYVDAGLVSPLNEFITEDYKKEFNPSAFTTHVIDGNIYAVPEQASFIRMYYNKDLFEKSGLDPNTPPATLEEMMDYAKKITQAGKGEFYGFGIPIKSASSWERYVDDICILSGETGPFGFDYTTGRFDFAKQKETIQYFAEMYKQGVLMPGSESIDIEMLRANFVAGKIGMYFDGNWMINGYNNEIEGGRDTNWETALVPIAAEKERAKDYLTLSSGRCISSGSKYKAEAFEAINYVIHNIVAAPTRANELTILPSFTLIESVNAAINETPAVKELKGMVGATQEEDKLSSFPINPHLALTLEGDGREAVYPLLVIQGDSMNIDEELSKLSDTYNKALDKAVEEGVFTQEQLKPANFDYYTR